MISKALFLVIIFSMQGHPDEIYKERIREDITLMQCTSKAQEIMPRIWHIYDGYTVKSFGCMTEDQIRGSLARPQ